MTSETALAFVGILATAVFAGITGAMVWFRSQRIKIEGDVDDLRCEVRSQNDEYRDNDRDIAVLKTEIRNHVSRLEEIGDTTKDTNRKMDDLARQLTTVLLAVNRGNK